MGDENARGKTCTKCGEFKPFSEFHKKKSMKDGYRSACKMCTNAQNTAYRISNRDKCIESSRKYKEKNREKIRKSAEKYRKENREACLERIKTWQRRNAHYLIEYRRKYYEENKEKIREKQKEYEANNREKKVIREQRRIARKKSLPQTFTDVEWAECLRFFDNKCCYCGMGGEMQQEHFIPVSKGGGYEVTNILPACPSCNASKNNKEYSEWYVSHPAYSAERHRRILEYFENVSSRRRLK